MAAAAIPWILTGISALSGFLGNREKKTTQDSTMNTDMTNTNMPTYDPKSQALRDLIINYYMDNLQSNDNMFGGYEREGLSNINAGTRSLTNSIQNILAQRGIRGDAGSWATLAPQIAKQTQMASFLNSIPLLKDQRNQNVLQSTASFLSSLPVGNTSHQVGTQKSQTTGTQPGNPWAGALASGGSVLAGLYGNGAFSKTPTSYNTAQLPMANRSPNLASLFSLPTSMDNPYATGSYIP